MPSSLSTQCLLRLYVVATATLLLALTGCAGLAPLAPRVPTHAIAASTSTELGALAQQVMAQAPVQASAPSGLRPMPQADVALDARLTLIRHAQSSLDLQYYLVGDDDTGHLLMRELCDAAARGVRVRLLMDDFYTAGMDRLLLGLAGHPNIAVRLFNPFGGGRDNSVSRMLGMAFDFTRLNHRMHNKLFIADGAIAIAGGRNMADGYFTRGPDNFIDFDALAVGPVVPQLQTIFDTYWNSEHVRDIASVASSNDTPESLRTYFEHNTSLSPGTVPASVEKDYYGEPLLSVDLAGGLQHLAWTETSAFADTPDKVQHGVTPSEMSTTALYHSLDAFREARSELTLFSPYVVPGRTGLAGLKEARDHNITVRVITNSMATTDEPLASLAYERYRLAMLKMGIELYELRPMLIGADQRNGPGASRARWHAKMAFIDRKTMVLGSMNLDQRSARTNTELILLIRSPEFVNRVLTFFNSTRAQDVDHVYNVRLKPDGTSLQWVALQGAKGALVLDEEPDLDYLLRLRLFLLSPFVSEDLL